MFERIRREGLRNTLDRFFHGETSSNTHPHHQRDTSHQARGFEPTQERRNEVRWPKGYQRADQRIYEEVCETMMENEDLDASNLEVKVEAGVVTLTGVVESRVQKRLASDLAEDARGVKDVNNQLRVEAPLMQ